MKNSELISILRKARRPEPPGEFWEEFPQQVARQLNHPRMESRRSGKNWFPRLAWGLATVLCILAAFVLGHWRGRMETKPPVANNILQNAKFVRETLAMFPDRVRAIVQDEHGLSLILSDSNNVPASAPLYVRVCDDKRCASVVTFSGQEIEIAGQKVTVLSNARGGIILEGNRFVWSSDGENYAEKNLRIEAKNLDTTL